MAALKKDRKKQAVSIVMGLSLSKPVLGLIRDAPHPAPLLTHNDAAHLLFPSDFKSAGIARRNIWRSPTASKTKD